MIAIQAYDCKVAYLVLSELYTSTLHASLDCAERGDYCEGRVACTINLDCVSLWDGYDLGP
ncbi:hypothetical protein HanRHA438_Chr10g0460151 [Helianthus annuus]|nr:hypothetical protein HanRHA438_Chr10g0460151 [Helianthus annuus]